MSVSAVGAAARSSVFHHMPRKVMPTAIRASTTRVTKSATPTGKYDKYKFLSPEVRTPLHNISRNVDVNENFKELRENAQNRSPEENNNIGELLFEHHKTPEILDDPHLREQVLNTATVCFEAARNSAPLQHDAAFQNFKAYRYNLPNENTASVRDNLPLSQRAANSAARYAMLLSVMRGRNAARVLGIMRGLAQIARESR